MTAQLLPSVITSPFNRHFDTRANIYCGSWSAYPSCPTISSSSLKPCCVNQDPQSSSASIPSVSSAPAQVNKPDRDLPSSENILRGLSRQTPGPPSTNSVKVHSNHYESLPIAEDPRLCLFQPTHSDVRVGTEHTPRYLASPSQAPHRLAELHNGEKRTQGVHHDIASSIREHHRLRTSLSTEACCIEEEEHQDLSTYPREYTRDWFSAVGEPQSLLETSFLADTSEDTSDTWSHSGLHRKRCSTASSGFVHTMKTASLSNASFSLVPRSLRVGRSRDDSHIFSSSARHSVESDRPPTSASVDEAAFRRAIKRRQILVELVTSEESYIADLKALIYLYSTLLATTMTVPGRVRSSLLRNVHDLLSLHERLLERLHQAAYEAAARKWADTTSPRHLGSPPYHHKRWKSLESSVAAKLGRSNRRARSSIESTEVPRGRTYFGGAEPRDVADVAGIFRHFLSDFLVYEEYCANHSLISHELQRHSPALWSTYESGIESLARSLAALDRKRQSERKGLTVGDLLIKPIQRMTKYPLLFDDLLKQTPVADCPTAHSDLEAIMACLREVVQTGNKATDNHETRAQIQRRWSLQTRLICDKVSLRVEQFRMLGNIQLSGVLHVTWQTRNNKVDGRYALCMLFDTSLIIALPAGATAKFEAIAFLHLRDTRVESASDGRGLQCHSTLYTWKVCFEISGHLHEFILSACSAIEESAWRGGLQNKDAPGRRMDELLNQIPSSISLNLRSIGQVYSQQSSTLSRNPSVQRAATVGNRATVCQVIIRNTSNPQDLHEFRQPSSSLINRSQSHMTSNRVVVLAPKRSQRSRLESTLGDVWTKEKLPYPGMITSRSGQIIRASAGSLARKLSLSSIHTPFSRRSGSLSLSSRKSFDLSNESRHSKTKHSTPIFEIRKESLDELPPARTKSREIPEVDTMDNVVSRMIGSSVSRNVSISQGHHALARRGTKSLKISQDIGGPEVGPEDPAEVYYAESKEMPEQPEIVEEGLAGRKKRWSNPLGILKVLSADGLRHMLYSSK